MYDILLKLVHVGVRFSLGLAHGATKAHVPIVQQDVGERSYIRCDARRKTSEQLEFSFLSVLLERMSSRFSFRLMRGCLALLRS